jgi:hypothetical protein
MTGAASFYDLVSTVRVQVTDPTAVLSHPAPWICETGPDGETAVYLPSSVEEAVVARFTALLDQMYPTIRRAAGLRTLRTPRGLATPPTQ